MVAERDGQLVGSVTGYIRPDAPDTLFVWQVAVHPLARGEALGARMLDALFQGHPQVRFLETTVTADNAASWRMFERFAEQRSAALERAMQFEQDKHFAGLHASEYLARIGPFQSAQSAPQSAPQSTPQSSQVVG